MELFVENYKKDPFEKAWTYSQGIASIEKRDEFVINLSRIGAKSIANAYKIPSDFSPNPSTYSLEEIAPSCPNIYSDFIRIPF